MSTQEQNHCYIFYKGIKAQMITQDGQLSGLGVLRQ